MNLNESLTNLEAVCINLDIRKDKRKWMKVQCKRKNLKIKYHTATLNDNPKRGCLMSHLSVIKKARENGLKQLLILEDDAKFIMNPNTIKVPPEDWDMLYLGGTVHRVVNRDNKYWNKVHCWTTHAYILNLENDNLIDEIMKAAVYEGEIDRFYLERIHPLFNVYMANPMVAIQKQGYSDIEKTEVNYDFMQKTLDGLSIPEFEMVDGNYVLKLPHIETADLPMVSIVTPTRNRRCMFSLANRNFMDFLYPRDKLEWIIIDDSDEDNPLDDLVMNDKRIRYLQLRNPDDKTITTTSIAYKRNLGAMKARGEIIVHMDDDDYYPPESILARVKVLVKYREKGIKCVGCTQIGTYNIMNNMSSMSSDGPINFSEASMAYYKDFWNERKYIDTQLRGEHKGFTENRLEQCMDIPYYFILIAFTHKDNYTTLRSIDRNVLKFKDTNKDANYYDLWDEETQYFMSDLRKYLEKVSSI